MVPMTRANVSTLLYSHEEEKYLIRVSQWVEPDDLEIVEDNPDKPTLRVEVKHGRFTIRGSVDRAAYRDWLTKDVPSAPKDIPMPTSAAPTFREKMYRP